MKRLPWIALFPVLLLADPLSAQDTPKDTKPAESVEVPDAVKGITARELGGHMRFLASDLMRGRDTGSPEIRVAAEYLSSRLYAAGAEPSGDGEAGKKSYFQGFTLETLTPLREGTSLTLEIEKDGTKRSVPLQIGTDVAFLPRNLSMGEVNGPLVFAGYGIVNPESKVNDYEGLDVKGKFVLVLSGQPPEKVVEKPQEENKEVVPEKKVEEPAKKAVTQVRTGRGPNANFMKIEAALKRGALGVMVVQPPVVGEANRPLPVGQLVVGFGRPTMTMGPPPASIPLFTLGDSIRDQIFQATNIDSSKPTPRLIDNIQAKFVLAGKKDVKADRNVIGFFPGTDPEKQKEVIIFSAHFDHVGVNERGEIFNGSDDNASGTSALLEIAEAFGDGPKPARTIAILWVSGEEKGLLGSEWFADHIPLPAGYKIVADINIDMISRNNGKAIGLTPSEKHPSHSTLATLAKTTANAEGLEVKYDADQFFFRTDSANFAKRGIPVVFFFCGVHEDYHRPTDDVDKADFDKAAKVARAAYRLGWLAAQTPEIPKLIKAQ